MPVGPSHTVAKLEGVGAIYSREQEKQFSRSFQVSEREKSQFSQAVISRLVLEDHFCF